MDLRPYVIMAGVMAGGSCSSDDREVWAFSTTGTTEIDPTEVSLFTTGEPVDSTGTTAPPIPEKTCRHALICASGCALDLGELGPETEWQQCFEACFAQLTAEEWLLLFDLLECVVPLCSSMPQCMPDDGTCTACYVASLGAVEPNLPMGCEAQAKACD